MKTIAFFNFLMGRHSTVASKMIGEFIDTARNGQFLLESGRQWRSFPPYDDSSLFSLALSPSLPFPEMER